MHFENKRVRLTALAEFDLVEAQNFYASNGAWVLDHFMTNIDAALTDLATVAGIHPVFSDITACRFRTFLFRSIMILKVMM